MTGWLWFVGRVAFGVGVFIVAFRWNWRRLQRKGKPDDAR